MKTDSLIGRAIKAMEMAQCRHMSMFEWDMYQDVINELKTMGELHTVPQGGEEKRNECDCLRRPDSEGIPTGLKPVSPTTQSSEIRDNNVTPFDALTYLVGLRAHKDQFGKTTYYEEMRPRAWKRAINALENQSMRNPLESEYIISMLEKHADRADMFQPNTEVIETRWVKLMTKPEPVMVSLEMMTIAVSFQRGKYEGYELDREQAKAVLDAAGVKYVD